MKKYVLAVALLVLASSGLSAADELTDGWAHPPRDARLRAYWWWLNGCVTRESITRDLEEMKAKGFGGALICDADGSSQDGNERAPHGPDFLSSEWRELYRHTLREAARLGLEMSLNIQSGWNLGGPMVTADDAAKKLVWSEARVSGPGRVKTRLPEPPSRDDYYRDAFVVAYRIGSDDSADLLLRLAASSSQSDFPVGKLADGDGSTFWVSAGDDRGGGPTPAKPAWVQLEFAEPVEVNQLCIRPRPGYGPRRCELLAGSTAEQLRTVKSFAMEERETASIKFDPVEARVLRLVIYGAFDPRRPQAPRNVQIAELFVAGPAGAWPRTKSAQAIRNWQQKAGHASLHFSAPDTTLLLEQEPSLPGEEVAGIDDVLDLSAHLDDDGTLEWEAPEGSWQVLRFGYTIGNRSYVSTSSEGWEGYAIDVLDRGAFERYWDAVVAPLIADAGPLAGRTLKYLHTDSWEVEPLNWTPSMRDEFHKRRGYDLLKWSPVLTGRIIESRNISHRFLHDFRKTLGDLAIDNHYRPFRDRAHQHELLIHPESGGPHAVPIDAQRCLGFSDVPMSEFWAWSWRHRIGDDNRFFVKQPASAAHTYGHRFVAAEGFTTIGPHWQETLWDNLKPSFDKACCEGLNRLVWHEFVCSPREQGMPGIQYFAGTHVNPNVTWWAKSEPFFSYINRCQFMLQRGLFVADVCYYYGDHVPNFAQHKRTDPAGVLPGFDYDVITEEALLTRATVRDGLIVLPDGMQYRLLVLRNHTAISLPVLRKVRELVDGGVMVLGPRPTQAESLTESDEEVRRIGESLWGRGRVATGMTARAKLIEAGIVPDCQVHGSGDDVDLDYVHRRDGDVDIYFVANRNKHSEQLECSFRVTGKVPELWDPVSGVRCVAPGWESGPSQTSVPLEFAPCGSWFVVFRATNADRPPAAKSNFPRWKTQRTLTGPWSVTFDPKWNGPGTIELDGLSWWNEHDNPQVKYYSGTAVYRQSFQLDIADGSSPPRQSLWLDLGEVRELAEVKINGRSCGVTWAPPFRVDVSDAVRAGSNDLVIEVVNFWPNRIIGDSTLPPDQRVTRTNIRKLTQDTPLMNSGLLGPVTLQIAQ